MASHRYWRFSITGSNWSVTAVGEVQFFDSSGTLITVSSASASSTYPGYPASNAIDGNPATFWNSGGNPNTAAETLTCDLGSAQDVASVMIWGRQDLPAQSPTKFTVQWSDDNSAWTDATGLLQPPPWDFTLGWSAAIDAPAANAYCNYRIKVYTSTLGAGASIAGLEFRATVGGASIAVNGAPGCNYNWIGLYPAANAYDNDPATKWYATGLPAWISYALRKSQTVAEVWLQASADDPNNAPLHFCLEGSNDAGTNWTEITCWDATGWTPGEPGPFPVPVAGGGQRARIYLLW